MRPVLAALLGHWRRHPVELATLLIGLAVATALWSGVQALNAEARASYARAAAAVGGDRFATVAAADGQRIALADYVALRRAGWPVTPLLEGDLRRGAGSLRVIGIEPLSLPAEAAIGIGEGADRLQAFLRPPYRALAAPETAARLAGAADLPPLEASDTLPPDTLVVDIGVAARLLGLETSVSRLLMPADETRPLPPGLAERLRITPPSDESELDRLTGSFHLNLTAFGFLSFVVGLFIVYAAAGLAFEQRRPTFRTLRACGVSARRLGAALLLELAALALVAGLLGTAAGYLIAAALLPDVAASLRGLYGARLPGSLSLGPAWWAAGLGMSLAGALAAAGTSLWRAWRLPLLAPAQPQAWLQAERRGLRLQLALAALLAAGALGALAFGRGLPAGFAVMAGLLLAAALALPAALAAILAAGARRARHPVAEWAWADARQGLRGLSLALMALLLALAVNIGVGTMVESFRRTFLGYLDQRLAAELYVTGRDDTEGDAIAAWLAARPEVAAVLPIWSVPIRYRDFPVELYGFRDDPMYRDNWPLVAALPDAWDRVAAGEAALVSEQLARRFGLGLGDPLALPAPDAGWTLPVAAIYPDYGNVEGQVMVAVDALTARWPQVDRRRSAARADPDAVPVLIADLRSAFGLDQEVIDQRGLKAVSRAIFERTFAVTVALNALTLAVAGIALLASLLTLSGARLVQVAPVWALGLTRRRLAAIELARSVGLAALTAAAALPLGLALAWVLTAVVNVRAFGWRLPVLLFPGQWLTLFLLAIATAALAAAWPAFRLRRASPLTLLQGFSNEH
jgi:putative ABC transport system permease protein